VEVSDVRKRILAAIERAKQTAAARRVRTDEAARAYSIFLDTIAVPIFRQVANVLRAEGYPFGIFTPAGSVKLVSDRTAEDSIAIALDTGGDEPRVIGHTTRSRGSRVIESERPVGDPATLTESDLLDFLMKELEALLGR
jgi:hypothetical protein